MTVPLRKELEKAVWKGFNGYVDVYNKLEMEGYYKRTNEAIDALVLIVERRCLEIIGENESEFDTPKPELENMIRNRLREKQRSKISAT